MAPQGAVDGEAERLESNPGTKLSNGRPPSFNEQPRRATLTYACLGMIGWPTIFTIGHSVHSVDKFVELLQEQNIDVLADIRTSPTSRFSPQFNRDQLKDALMTRGVTYVFLGKELGGRPNGQHPTSLEDKMATYKQIRATQGFNDGLARLKEGATKHAVAIMCSEEDPESCHRHLLVAPALEDLGFAISHIRANGRRLSEAELMLTHSEKALRIVGRQLSLLPDDPPS